MLLFLSRQAASNSIIYLSLGVGKSEFMATVNMQSKAGLVGMPEQNECWLGKAGLVSIYLSIYARMKTVTVSVRCMSQAKRSETWE